MVVYKVIVGVIIVKKSLVVVVVKCMIFGVNIWDVFCDVFLVGVMKTRVGY